MLYSFLISISHFQLIIGHPLRDILYTVINKTLKKKGYQKPCCSMEMIKNKWNISVGNNLKRH